MNVESPVGSVIPNPWVIYPPSYRTFDLEYRLWVLSQNFVSLIVHLICSCTLTTITTGTLHTLPALWEICLRSAPWDCVMTLIDKPHEILVEPQQLNPWRFLILMLVHPKPHSIAFSSQWMQWSLVQLSKSWLQTPFYDGIKNKQQFSVCPVFSCFMDHSNNFHLPFIFRAEIGIVP